MEKDKRTVKIQYVGGGRLFIDGFRVSGPSISGHALIIKSWEVEAEDILEQLKGVEGSVKIECINGVEGLCIDINDIQIAGRKPWGRIISSFQVPVEDILKIIGGSQHG